MKEGWGGVGWEGGGGELDIEREHFGKWQFICCSPSSWPQMVHRQIFYSRSSCDVARCRCIEVIAPDLSSNVTNSVSHWLIGHRVGRPGYGRMSFPSWIEQLVKQSMDVSRLVLVLVSMMVRFEPATVPLLREESLLEADFLHGL